ncbi:MAG: HEAT repeat domain-containing protein [Pirellulales bacterium]|nr:HEAT repeat domain-containing protein [Pirellulales bacterium]
MTTGLDNTWKILGDTANEAADEVLVAALDAESPQIRAGAFQALLRRPISRRHVLIMERWHTFDDTWRGMLCEHGERLEAIIRPAILSTSPDLCENGCQAVLWLRNFDLLPALLNAAIDTGNPQQDRAGKTLLQLVELFYEDLAGAREHQTRRDPQRLRDQWVGLFEQALGRFSIHRSLPVLESFLILTHRDNPTLKQILNDPLQSAFSPSLEILTHNTRGGILRLLLSFLDDPHAPSAALAALAHRGDAKFIEYLLRKIGYEPSAGVAANLRRIDSIPWLQGDLQWISRLDEAQQQAVATLALRANIKRASALRVLEFVLLHGQPAARRAAARQLSEFQGTEANKLLLRGLSDPDPQVRAHLLKQLRPRGLPGAISLLLKALQSPAAVEREAARECLREFSFKRLVAVFDTLDEQSRQNTARIVAQVDPHTSAGLRDEFRSLSRSRRLKAVAITQLLNLAEEQEAELTRLLRDEDHLVRAAAVRALALCDTESARDALEAALTDRSSVVQEAAASSLQDLNFSAPLPPLPPWEQEPVPQ